MAQGSSRWSISHHGFRDLVARLKVILAPTLGPEFAAELAAMPLSHLEPGPVAAVLGYERRDRKIGLWVGKINEGVDPAVQLASAEELVARASALLGQDATTQLLLFDGCPPVVSLTGGRLDAAEADSTAGAYGLRVDGEQVGLALWHDGGIPLDEIECQPKVAAIEPVVDRLAAAREVVWAVRAALAAVNGTTFSNNSLLGLDGFQVCRVDRKGGDRARSAVVKFRKVTYKDHVFLGDLLHRDVVGWLDERLREGVLPDAVRKRVTAFLADRAPLVPADELKVTGRPLALQSCADFPAIPFRVGVGVVVVTADGKVVVPVRSRSVDIGEGGTYSASVGEGMSAGDTASREEAHGAGPKQAEPPEDDPPSLVACGRRALREELGLAVGVDYAPEDLRCVGVNLSLGTLVPYFATVLRTDLSYEEVGTARRERAKDTWENDRLLGPDWTAETARQLVRGELSLNDGRRIRAGSTRERVFFAQAALATGLTGGS